MDNLFRVVAHNPKTRIWNGRSVDRDLDDTWLEELNKLQRLDLINICAGHSDADTPRDNQNPHIYLTLKPNFVETILRSYQAFADSMKCFLSSRVNNPDTEYTLELRHILTRGGAVIEYPVAVRVRLRRKEKRYSEESRETLSSWFDTSVSEIARIDCEISKIIDSF